MFGGFSSIALSYILGLVAVGNSSVWGIHSLLYNMWMMVLLGALFYPIGLCALYEYAFLGERGRRRRKGKDSPREYYQNNTFCQLAYPLFLFPLSLARFFVFSRVQAAPICWQARPLALCTAHLQRASTARP